MKIKTLKMLAFWSALALAAPGLTTVAYAQDRVVRECVLHTDATQAALNMASLVVEITASLTDVVGEKRPSEEEKRVEAERLAKRLMKDIESEFLIVENADECPVGMKMFYPPEEPVDKE